MPGIAGDFGALDDLQADILTLANANFRRSVNAQLEETTRSLVAREFESSTDPYGRAWLPLKHRDGRPLLDTARLRNSFGGDGSDASSFRFGSDVVYAGIHQYGGTIEQLGRINLHSKKGRFISQGRGATKRYASAKLSFSGPRTITIPQRQILPDPELPDRWLSEFWRVVDAELRDLFGGA